MKKVLLATLLFVGVAATSFAQDGGKFSIGVDAGLPLGDAKDVSSVFVGGSLKYDQPIAEKTAFTLTAGYSYLAYNDMGKAVSKLIGENKSGVGFIPVKAGIKYFFADAFYGEAQLGAAFSTQKGAGTAFAYSPGIGYKFSDVIDLGVRYEAWSKNGTTNQIAARLGFSF